MKYLWDERALIDLAPHFSFGAPSVDGPWVFGMVEKWIRKVKMFNVPDRKGSTLIPILRKHVHPQSTIWSDEWPGYVSVKDYFCDHKTVCHKDFLIDPETTVHTQSIECLWSHAKLNILRNKRGNNLIFFQSHLSHMQFGAVDLVSSFWCQE